MTLVLILAALLASVPAQEEMQMELVPTGVGRFAVFADRASITADQDSIRIRALQISEDDMVIGDVAYTGGWTWWRFDCAGRMAERLDFASLRADGGEGPATPDDSPPMPIAPGGDADELAAVVCEGAAAPVVARTTAQAVQIARMCMQDDQAAICRPVSVSPK
ncbi:hypothetical protein [Brevundimonas diminuta]|uniref:hypothetical protein n=1 Tax=Brevundimonas diminuta TaxID=293 RepID=UPI00320B316D